MKLTHAGTIKYSNGLIEIDVVVHKSYTFLLESEYAHQKFLEEVKHQKYGAAINTLKKFNYKKKTLDSDTKYSGNPDNNSRKEIDIFHAPML